MDAKERDELEAESPSTAENREKKEMVTLGGTAVTEAGKLTRSNFFRFIGHDLDEYESMALTSTQARRIHTHLQKLSTGSYAMTPMYCSGAQCPFADRCPLVALRSDSSTDSTISSVHGKAPIGKQCLIEVQLLKEFVMRYFVEYDVDPNNFTEVAYINELAEIEILLMRLNMNLAKRENAELIIDQVMNMTPDGTPIMQRQLSPFMEQKERLANRRSKIIKLMVGDRQEKYKMEAALKIKLDQDPSQRMADMRTKLENLERELKGKLNLSGSGNNLPPTHMSPEDIIDADLEE